MTDSLNDNPEALVRLKADMALQELEEAYATLWLLLASQKKALIVDLNSVRKFDARKAIIEKELRPDGTIEFRARLRP